MLLRGLGDVTGDEPARCQADVWEEHVLCGPVWTHQADRADGKVGSLGYEHLARGQLFFFFLANFNINDMWDSWNEFHIGTIVSYCIHLQRKHT